MFRKAGGLQNQDVAEMISGLTTQRRKWAASSINASVVHGVQ